MGRGRHDKHVGHMSLPEQLRALAYPEPVLFVGDDQPQSGEPDISVQQGMGADDQMGPACRQVHQRGIPFTFSHASDQQAHLQIQRFEQLNGRLCVLTGQDFRRRHQSDLPAIRNGGIGGNQRDNRLSGADISLQQPIHGHRLRHVGKNLRNNPLLRIRASVRQPAHQWIKRVKPNRHTGFPGASLALHTQRHLDFKQLIKTQVGSAQPPPPLRNVVYGRIEWRLPRI